MVEKNEQNLKVIANTSTETRGTEVVDSRLTRQTNPIARKLLDFSLSNKTRKFSVIDLLRHDRHE